MIKIPTSILRNLLILALSIGLVLATATGQANRYVDLLLENKDFKTDCEEAETPSLIDPRDEIGLVIDKYHRTVNCLFNTRIKILVEQMLEPESQNKKPLTEEQIKSMLENLSPPAIEPDSKTGEMRRKDCANENGGLNLSTYCLADAATKEYTAFRSALVVARKKTQQEAAQNLPENYPTKGGAIEQQQALQFGKNVQEYGAVIEKIDRELTISREALDLGLATYQELQMALPLHRKYKEVIKYLEEYRNKVSSIRKEVELYPTTFLDVTTTQCN